MNICDCAFILPKEDADENNNLCDYCDLPMWE